MNDERERLQQVKTLMDQRQYEAAREILQTMSDNPTAHKWLVQVEAAIARQNAPMPSEDEIARRMKAARDLIQAGDYAEARAMLLPIEKAPAAQEWLEKLDKRLAAAQNEPEPLRASAASAADTRAALAGMDRSPRGFSLPAALGPVGKTMRTLGIDPQEAGTALGLAVIAGLVAALLEGLLGIPGPYLIFALGAGIAMLTGPSYAMMRQRVDRGAIVMAALSGALTLLAWYLLSLLTAGDPNYMDRNVTDRDYYAAWFDDMANVPKSLLSGALLGLIGLGWYALLPRVPGLGQRAAKASSGLVGSLSNRAKK